MARVIRASDKPQKSPTTAPARIGAATGKKVIGRETYLAQQRAAEIQQAALRERDLILNEARRQCVQIREESMARGAVEAYAQAAAEAIEAFQTRAHHYREASDDVKTLALEIVAKILGNPPEMDDAAIDAAVARNIDKLLSRRRLHVQFPLERAALVARSRPMLWQTIHKAPDAIIEGAEDIGEGFLRLTFEAESILCEETTGLNILAQYFGVDEEPLDPNSFVDDDPNPVADNYQDHEQDQQEQLDIDQQEHDLQNAAYENHDDENLESNSTYDIDHGIHVVKPQSGLDSIPLVQGILAQAQAAQHLPASLSAGLSSETHDAGDAGDDYDYDFDAGDGTAVAVESNPARGPANYGQHLLHDSSEYQSEYNNSYVNDGNDGDASLEDARPSYQDQDRSDVDIYAEDHSQDRGQHTQSLAALDQPTGDFDLEDEKALQEYRQYQKQLKEYQEKYQQYQEQQKQYQQYQQQQQQQQQQYQNQSTYKPSNTYQQPQHNAPTYQSYHHNPNPTGLANPAAGNFVGGGDPDYEYDETESTSTHMKAVGPKVADEETAAAPLAPSNRPKQYQRDEATAIVTGYNPKPAAGSTGRSPAYTPNAGGTGNFGAYQSPNVYQPTALSQFDDSDDFRPEATEAIPLSNIMPPGWRASPTGRIDPLPAPIKPSTTGTPPPPRAFQAVLERQKPQRDEDGMDLYVDEQPKPPRRR